jgi:hypothetical protein
MHGEVWTWEVFDAAGARVRTGNTFHGELLDRSVMAISSDR